MKTPQYINLPIDCFYNPKIRKLSEARGREAVATYTIALIEIFKRGAYIKEEEMEDLIDTASLYLNTDPAEIKKDINEAEKAGLFNSQVRKEKGVITNELIQDRYNYANKKGRLKPIPAEYQITENPAETSETAPKKEEGRDKETEEKLKQFRLKMGIGQ